MRYIVCFMVLCPSQQLFSHVKMEPLFSWYQSVHWRVLFELPRGKTNNVVSEQVRHKPTCTSTEKS